MIEFEHLFQFVAFGAYGTLSKAAEYLHVSQPTLTRNMKLLEQEFGVMLFTRSKKHIALNENGLLALKEAKKVLSELDAMTDKVRQLDRSRHTLALGSCAPYPVMDFVRLATELYPAQSLTTELRGTSPLLQGLREGRYQVIILPFTPTDTALISFPFGKESLYFNLPKGHPREKCPSLSFSDLDGTTMIVYSHIGFWKDLIKETMPHSRFLLQEQRDDFFELEKASTLPSFITDRVLSEETLKDRTSVPIADQSAHIEYCLVMTKKMSQRYPLFAKRLNQK